MKLFTKTVCPKCMLIKTVLDAAEIEYEAINIDHNEEARQVLEDEGIMAVPVLFVNEKYLAGVPEINKAISEAKK